MFPLLVLYFPFKHKFYLACPESFNFVKLNDLSYLFPLGNEQRGRFCSGNVLMNEERQIIWPRVTGVQRYSEVNLA
jgi:hypothetical protein